MSTAKVDTRTIDYSAYAPHYDCRRYSGLTNEYLAVVRRRGLARAVRGIDRSAPILDVGCGTGRGLCELRGLGFRRVTGLDYTAAMLARAAAKLQTPGGAAPRLIVGDAFRLPFADGTFSCVVSLNFLHMFRFELQRELVAEMARVCAPGGTLILELESIHKGLGVTRYLEQRRSKGHTKFNSVREVARLLPDGVIAKHKVIGTVLPWAYRVLQYVPRVGVHVESIAAVPPFNWLASRVFVVGGRL